MATDNEDEKYSLDSERVLGIIGSVLYIGLSIVSMWRTAVHFSKRDGMTRRKWFHILTLSMAVRQTLE